jgi:hypothetical protein
MKSSCWHLTSQDMPVFSLVQTAIASTMGVAAHPHSPDDFSANLLTYLKYFGVIPQNSVKSA